MGVFPAGTRRGGGGGGGVKRSGPTMGQAQPVGARPCPAPQGGGPPAPRPPAAWAGGRAPRPIRVVQLSMRLQTAALEA